MFNILLVYRLSLFWLCVQVLLRRLCWPSLSLLGAQAEIVFVGEGQRGKVHVSLVNLLNSDPEWGYPFGGGSCQKD